MKLYNFENEENNWDEWKERWPTLGLPMLRIVILASRLTQSLSNSNL
jgi:hypothetical protein